MKEYAREVLTVSGGLIVPAILVIAVLGIIRLLNRPAVPEAQIKESVPLPTPKKKMTASTILLLIGTAFIVFASIAFVAANWNDMEPAGKVFTLLGASVTAFAVSAVLNAAVKLKRTSVSFYAMGTLIAAVAFITAGYYKLFGSWFSVGGDGEMLLYGIAAMIVAAVSLFGYTFYKNTAMYYIGFSFAAFAVIMFCGQISSNSEMFFVLLIAVQFIMTAVTELFAPGSGKSWGKPLKTVARAAACVYASIALLYVYIFFADTDSYALMILAAVLVQLFFYGIYKKSAALIIAADIFAYYTAMMVSIHVETAYKTAAAKIVFSGLTLLIYAANRFIKRFGNAERVTALAVAVLGAFVAMDSSAPILLKIAAPLLVSAAIWEFAFNKNIVIQYAAGILSPFMPFLVTVTISDSIRMNVGYENFVVKPLAFCGYALLCMAAAAAALFMRKICFPFHAKHPLKTQAFIYANLTAAGIALIAIAESTEISVIILVLCAVQFALSCLPRANFTALASSIAALITICEIIGDLVPANYVNLENCIYTTLTAAVLVASRFVFPESIIRIGKEKRIAADVFLFTAWLPLCCIRSTGDYFRFLTTLALAFYAAAFIKNRTEREVKSYILTGSAALVALALLRRPFLLFDSDTVSTKINLLIFVLLGIAGKLIWRQMKLVSKLLSTTIFVSCFASLIIDGIVHDGVLNRIFVLCVTAFVLVLSFIWKSKTWFTASSVSLVVLTGFFMHEYIASAGWWIYLLAVGIILVTVAAVNEACRKKGENVLTTVERKLSDWTW